MRATALSPAGRSRGSDLHSAVDCRSLRIVLKSPLALATFFDTLFSRVYCSLLDLSSVNIVRFVNCLLLVDPLLFSLLCVVIFRDLAKRHCASARHFGIRALRHCARVRNPVVSPRRRGHVDRNQLPVVIPSRKEGRPQRQSLNESSGLRTSKCKTLLAS